MAGPFGIPLGLPPELDRFLRGMASSWDNQQRVQVMGQKDTGAGTNVNIRFMASRATQWVQVHVQSTATDKGGATYSTSNYVSSARVGIPLGLPPELDRFLRGMASSWDNQQRVQVMGQKDTGAGTDVNVRFMASRATQWVQVHVQSTASSKGGATYSTSNYVSTARVDCRSDRQQDQTIARNGTNHYYLEQRVRGPSVRGLRISA